MHRKSTEQQREAMVSFLYSLPSVRDEPRKALSDIEQPKNNEEKEEEVMSESEVGNKFSKSDSTHVAAAKGDARPRRAPKNCSPYLLAHL